MKRGLIAVLILLLMTGICYAADTITIQDGLTNAQTAADSDFYTVDSTTSTAVGQYVVAIPQSANRVRVLYNNLTDADATVYTRCRLSKTTAVDTLAKDVAEVDAWAEIAASAVREGATVDISGLYDVTLYIDCCLSSTNAHANGTEIIVQISTGTTGDAFWSNLTSFSGPAGTAIKVDLGGDEAAGQTELTVTNPVTNNLDITGRWIFLEHTGTPANSELVYQTAQSGD